MKNSYAIENIDCAMCALKIEEALNRLPGVHYAALDFTNQRLHLEAEDLEQVRAAIARLEPEATLKELPEGSGAAEPETEVFRLNRELVMLGIALLLFGAHWLFGARLQSLGVPGLHLLPALAAYLLAGANVFRGAWRTLRRGDLFDENVLMVIATIGALAIDAVAEAVTVMLFFKTGELLQNLAVSRSRRSIRALLASRPDKAFRQTTTGLEAVAPEQVRVGDTLVVRPGEKVPLDGKVLSGDSRLDTSALTGEPVPLHARPGDAVMAGMINLHAALTLRVTRPFGQSAIAKVLELVTSAAARKAPTEKFITTFARWYTPAVVAAAAAVAVIPPLVLPDALFRTWIYRALVLLVISCPCALVISIPLGYFGGIGRASKNGILVKGSNYLDALAHLKTVVFDKTGTLTHGRFELLEVVPRNGRHPKALLTHAALAEMHATHPIAQSILAALRREDITLDGDAVSGHTALPGRGIRATVHGRTVLVGNDALLHEQGIPHDVCEVDGTAVHVVIDGEYAGHLRMGDAVKPEAAEALAGLRKEGVEQLVMLTGDNECAAAAVADQLQLDAFHAGLLPDEKVAVLEQIMARAGDGGKVAFVGDGINDAPVIARSDVGVAMGAMGSEAAIETADVVLMTGSPMKMVTAVRIARRTRTIVWQNIVMALAVKGVFVVLGAMGVASMWEAVFADVGVALAAVVNATRALHSRG
ncbi:heavy metal translocating P-type ATPase [Desulfatitalea alkaliphila]|uniref:P-type Zn(2+) transporter n=1 Tax=Desulfatitalea alkaliphila TaxID=2929485 RepID=A0AA41R3R2_9BACT|nr:heavy metal translocating P-type ATPase [Desulfatitalea alkaliphila]MCJ8501472.1 cadmium-translocating P-type ATPase [Desulfatitalea alkaliphila]